MIPGTPVAPFKADVGIAGTRVVRKGPKGRELRWQASIQDLGDLRVYGALETVDATGLFVTPAYTSAGAGANVVLPPPSAAASAPRVGPGGPARLWLLRKGSEAGAYTVVRVIDIR